MGYHKKEIKKGKLGTISKVIEEIEEFIDANEQGIKIMEHLELSDIYGALESLAMSYDLSMDDLQKMSNATKNAFSSGDRQ